MPEVFTKTADGTYYVTRHWAWMPEYAQGRYVWMGWVYETYLDGENGPECRVYFPYDPRTKPDLKSGY